METLSTTTTTPAIGIPSSSPISIFSSSSSSLKKKNFSATTPPPPRFLNFPIASKNDENEADLQSDSNKMNIVPFMNNRFSPLSKDAAMGLVLSAAVGRGWTTGSGMEGPPTPVGFDTDDDSNDTTKGRISTFPWSLFTKSPRRRMRVAFTCNICSQRTTRAINPHAYTDGTVFVQCCGCYAYHKLVDNLNLFEEMNCYVNPNFNYENPNGDVRFKYLDMDSDDDDDDDDIFPGL